MNNKFSIILICLCLFSKKTDAQQQEAIKERVVLFSDSVSFFETTHVSSLFGESYFITDIKFGSSFTLIDYNSFVDRINRDFYGEIKSFKSADNTALICVFPKPTIRKISSFIKFIQNNFPETQHLTMLKNEVKHIQVVREYDINNKAEEKGFN